MPGRNRTVNVIITSSVLNGATPVSGATVSVRVTTPGGTVTTLNHSTDGSGRAKVTYAMRWPAVAGTYQVTSVATKGAASSSTATSFVVQ
jgi:hypothetical protein